HPKGKVPVELPDLPVTPFSSVTVRVVPVEAKNTERASISPDPEPCEAERREAALVHSYRHHLEGLGHTVGRLLVIPPGESRPLYSDLWDETARELIEAKGTVNRDNLRQAVGQLLDYGRFADAKTHAVLVPSRPRPDLLAYLAAVGIDIISQTVIPGSESPSPSNGRVALDLPSNQLDCENYS
ncbi:MAG: hypothetical protein M3319_04910, partial [Actinomycetota bacterium]|nr:hypothetical protein [Actinomycetota bacterium]